MTLTPQDAPDMTPQLEAEIKVQHLLSDVAGLYRHYKHLSPFDIADLEIAARQLSIFVDECKRARAA